jgi:hypothetical protein
LSCQRAGEQIAGFGWIIADTCTFVQIYLWPAAKSRKCVGLTMPQIKEAADYDKGDKYDKEERECP